MFAKSSLAAALLVAAALVAPSTTAQAQSKLSVGVSWSNFQEERWKIDEAAIKAELSKRGATYLSADAQSNTQKQLADIEGLIARGAQALIILAQDSQAIQPAVQKASAEKIPVVAYDRLIEAPGVFYLTFDNVEVGRIQAREVFKRVPKGNYVYIKGSSSDPNADFLNQGQKEVLKAAVDRGDIKIVGEQYTDGWKPEVAQRNMEQILTAANNKVDAVLASNDGTAGGAIAALTAQGLQGKVAVSGQDADQAALNRVALGTQTVTVWKDARKLGASAGAIAVELAKGAPPDKIKGAAKFKTPKGLMVDSILLTPQPIDKGNLNLVIEGGWSSKERICRGVTADKPKICQ